MSNEYISRESVLAGIEQTIENSGCVNHEREIIDCVRYGSAADVVEVVRCNKGRLTRLGTNGFYGLVKVKADEQEVDSPYKNTLEAIFECFQRLAEYENAEFGMDGGEQHE